MECYVWIEKSYCTRLWKCCLNIVFETLKNDIPELLEMIKG